MSALTDMLARSGRGGQQSQMSYAGLDPSKVQTQTTGGFGNKFAGGGYQDPYDVTTYNDGGQTWTKSGAGWTGAGGQTVGDLGGYLGMREQQKQGADFGQYQNQLNQLLQNPSSIQQDPSYQFRLGQGQQAIERSAAARGMGNSGNVLAELAKYGQGMASQELGTQTNRLAELMRGSQQFGLSSGYFGQPKQRNVGYSSFYDPNSSSVW